MGRTVFRKIYSEKLKSDQPIEAIVRKAIDFVPNWIKLCSKIVHRLPFITENHVVLKDNNSLRAGSVLENFQVLKSSKTEITIGEIQSHLTYYATFEKCVYKTENYLKLKFVIIAHSFAGRVHGRIVTPFLVWLLPLIIKEASARQHTSILKPSS